MDSDERRREHHLDFAELKHFHSMAQRPRVRALLAYIVNLEEQVISGSTVSDEKDPEQEDAGYETMQKKVVPNDIDQLASSKFSIPVQKATGISEKETVLLSNEIPTIELQEIIESKNSQVREEENSSLETHVAERDSERKHKGIFNSGSSKLEEMPKLNDIKIPLNVKSSSCKNTEEPNHGVQRYSKELLHERAHPSDANETSPMETVSIENADTCNQANWVIPDRNDQLEEDCNGNTCETNPTVPPKNFPSRSARRKYLKRRLRREKKMLANANPTDANEVSPMEVSATDNAVVMPDRNKQLGNNGNGNTCETTSGADPGKFCSSSARRKYAQRQLKKEMKTRSRKLHKRTNCSDANDMPKMEVADICNQPYQVMPDRNEELEEDCNGNTCDPSSVVSTEKFPSKSLPCEYVQRFKKKRNEQGGGYAELQNVQRNGGDTTNNETHHHMYSHRQPLPPTYLNFMQRKEGVDALCLERLRQASSPTRVEYKSHYLAPASLSYSSGSYGQGVQSIYSGGDQNLQQSQPYKYNRNSSFTEDARGSVWKPTGNISVDSSFGTALGPAGAWFEHNSYVFTSRSNTS